ncbi:hypothetical protein OIU77_000941 [Salix suchowensis]|uniref:Ion transport domain-containing protein n=1 Tax=Salix suchowensis TaxID=1278906 RepID=A0ABQ9B7U8_9ROSI|nr:cyclic nucleotide-gated ion channel [Salix suchowensis]KAJ6376069.1 hypothetical protein OIU77_000941 [Salix suchowensis]
MSEVASRKKILDPQGPFLQKWNKIVVLSCLMAVSLDPMFFYVPVIDDRKKCLSLDSTMEITASVLRSFTDIFYMLHIIFHFRTGFIPPSPRVSGRGVLVDDTWAIAKRYLSSYFLIEILSVLPLPQVVILIITLKMGGSSYLNTKNVLKFVVIFQYVPRFIRIYPLYREVATSRILRETAWAGAAFNLFLYMIASHVIGAFWYLFSIERQTNCWRQACGIQDTCRREYLFCDGAGGAGNLSFLDNHCPIRTPNETVFNFGIFLDALQSGVVLSSTGFSDKFFYCFWWGLRNLSSLGQNLKTSTYVWETCFAVFISISGLVLLAFVTGNFQTHFQTRTARLEEMRIQRRDTEQWKETRGVDEEMPVQNLPRDLSVSSNTSSPSETEKMEEANHAGEDQGNIDHAITINGGEDQGNIDHANHNQ